jgi:hypothetical protein
MARISKAQWEENFAAYNSIILKIFLNEGWENVTYDRLSKETGLRKSTLQGYYPSNNDFEIAIKDKVIPIILKHLDFSSKDQLVASWKTALGSIEFKMVVRMLILQAHKKGANSSGRVRVISLTKLISKKLPNEDPLIVTQLLFGLTVTELMEIKF